MTSWLTIADAANRVSRSRRTIRAWIQAGHMTEYFGRVRETDLLEAERLARARMRAGRPRQSG